MITHYGNADRILIVDLSNLAYISYYGHKDLIANGNPSGHIFGFCAKIFRFAMKADNYNLGLVFALDGYPKRKMEIKKDYKGKREEKTFNPKPDVCDLVSYFKCSTLFNKEEEADDLIATFCHKNQRAGRTIDILSTDHDLYQLLGKIGVRQYNPIKRRYVRKEDLESKYGLKDWEKVPLWKSIFGDPSDNIPPALMRVPKKRFIPFINECDGTVDGFYERLIGESFTEKTNEKISNEDNKNKVKENFDIIKLRENIEYNETTCRGNKRFLDVFLKRYHCFSLLEETHLITGEQKC